MRHDDNWRYLSINKTLSHDNYDTQSKQTGMNSDLCENGIQEEPPPFKLCCVIEMMKRVAGE